MHREPTALGPDHEKGNRHREYSGEVRIRRGEKYE